MNAYCSIQELADEIGVAVTAANTAKLTRCCEAAALEIDQWIDSPDPPDYTPPWNPLMNSVNIVHGYEMWKASAAAFGVIGYDQTGAIRTPRNGFTRHAATLLPLKQQFGVA